MNAVTGFVAIVSLLLALAAGGNTTKPQPLPQVRPETPCNCPPGVPIPYPNNHNETLVRDTALVK